MNYERMTRVALYVAQGGMEDWPKSSVEDMAEQCGAEASYDFYQAFQREAPLRAERRTVTASTDRTNRLITGRANRMADALRTPQVQTLIQQAQAMGVDPYAAVAIYGIESDFGANVGTSGAGASGGMQVIDPRSGA